MVAAVLVVAFVLLALLWLWFWGIVIMSAFRGIFERDTSDA